MKYKICILVQSRLDSSRFPYKAFHKILGKYSIQYIIEECMKTEYDLLLLVPYQDVPIFKSNLLKKYPNLKIIGGEYTDVLSRYYNATKDLEHDIYVRLTGDCICIQHELIENVVSFYKKNYDKFDYVSNFTLKHSLTPEDAHNHSSSTNIPDGFSVEAFSKYALNLAYENIKNKNDDGALYDKEHVSTWIKRNLRCGLYDKDFLYVNGKFSLDEKKDISQIKSYLKLSKKNFIKIKCLKDL